MSNVFSNWNLFRGLRLVAGVSILVLGYRIMDWPLILLGFMLGFMSITNSQCGPFSGSCSINEKEKS